MSGVECLKPGRERGAVGNVDRGAVDDRARRRGRPRRRRGEALAIAADQPERGLRSGIGGGERGAEPARRAGNHDDPIGCTHQWRGRSLSPRAAAEPERTGSNRAQFAEPPRHGTLQPARLHQRPRPPQFRVVEAFDDDLGSARQPGQRIEIAGVEDEDAGHQLVQAQPAAAIARQLVDGQPPAGIERPAVDDDGAAAQQRLKPGKRGHRMQLVDAARAAPRSSRRARPYRRSAAPRSRELRPCGARP